jgi:hypothetical protein
MKSGNPLNGEEGDKRVRRKPFSSFRRRFI